MITLLQGEGINDLSTTVIIVVVLLILWVLIRHTGRKRKRRSFKSTSLGNLRRRYLEGSISGEEYERQKEELKKR